MLFIDNAVYFAKDVVLRVGRVTSGNAVDKNRRNMLRRSTTTLSIKKMRFSSLFFAAKSRILYKKQNFMEVAIIA